MRSASAIKITSATGILFTAICVFAAGGNHSEDPIVSPRDDWPAGLIELVNTGRRVQGHWINANDVFYYGGNAVSLNEFLEKYGCVKDTPLTVVIHAGEKPLTGALGKPMTISFDWQLQVTRRGWGAPEDPRRRNGDPGYVVTTHVWLSNDITLEQLEIPKHIVARSAGEIEEFITQHNSHTLVR